MARNPVLFLSFVIVALFIETAYGGEIGVYWGQNSNEGTLSEACATGKYAFINIAFLNRFGRGRNPGLNLAAGHCGSSPAGCSAAINDCQAKGVKVFLSIGGTGGDYSLESKADAQKEGAPAEFYDDLARSLSAYSTPGKKALLSFSPRCGSFNQQLKAVVGTGLFDYVWIRFYDSFTCSYMRSYQGAMLIAWDNWTAFIKTGKIFVGLPATQDAAEVGYIPPTDATNLMLPSLKSTPKYGGVVLWSRYFDDNNGYSSSIKVAV
ncbi:hypothetical protein CDL15_Pgr012015 [Punica granatum]|uniref:GH18 domain-containing protein n=1 Tax=Punica granatum TaxID=22663 RepID=A0A218VTT9_PUNGR|nr:hypothetical protein CDL15_Pgr012015 [Punica granatum]